MDLQMLKYLSDEDKTRYMVLERLFAQAGWKLLVEECQKWALAAKDRAAFAQTWDQNRLAVGNGFAYDHISRLEEITETEYEQKAEAAKKEQQLKDEEENE